MGELVKHSILKRKVNSISVVLSVLLAVMSAIALIVVYGGVQAGVRLNEERGGAQIIVVSDQAANELSSSELLFTGVPAPIYFDTTLADKVAAGEGISRSTVQFFGQTLDESCCSTADATRLIGIDFTTDWTVSAFAHIAVDQGLGAGRIIVGSGLGNKTGDTVRILGESYTVADVLDTTGTDLDTAVLMDIDIVRALSASQPEFAHYWETYGDPFELVSCVLVDVDESVISRDRVLNRINALSGLTAIERSEVVAESRESLGTLFSVMLAIGIVLVVSSVVQLFARFYGCVWERKTELALYRAVGASAADLKKMIGVEMAVLIGTGIVLGAVFGVVLQAVLLDMMTQSASFPYAPFNALQIAGVVVGCAVFFLVLGAASIAWPLRQINRLQPSVAMQQADID